MPQTAQDVIDRARKPLNDSDKVRYTDADLLAYLIAGMALVRGKRPDLLYGMLSSGSIPSLAFNDPVPLPDAVAIALADYVTARAEFVDDEHVNSNRAAQMLQLAVEATA